MLFAQTSGIPDAFISVTSLRSSRESFFRGVERQTEDRGQKRVKKRSRGQIEGERDRANKSVRGRGRKREGKSTGPRDARLVRARVCRASYPNPTQAVGGIKRSTEAR